jgi:N-acetyl-gamma-glutamyl-phosphate reductase
MPDQSCSVFWFNIRTRVFAGKCDLVLEEVQVEDMAPRFDLAFTALPHQTSMDVVAAFIGCGKRVIDLSADFRLHDPDLYSQWYRSHEAPQLLRQAVYGLTEIHRRRIPKARLIANPGCYPTSAILGLAPLFAEKLVRGTVLIDAKSGVTGAGRSSVEELSFSEVNENFKAYQVGLHRHTPEIEQELSQIGKKRISVVFTPHLLPMSRGILSTMYVELKESLRESRLDKLYRDFYSGEPFIRVLPSGSFPETKEVRGSNDCAIGFRYDSRVRRLVVITVIDNLVKGAAGQAVQNMNLMYGFPEVEGLRGAALVP